MRRCPHCKSPWVCWNWFTSKETNEWGHECHNCSHTFETQGHVDDGIPYNILIGFEEFFVEEGRFEREFEKSMNQIQEMFGKSDD